MHGPSIRRRRGPVAAVTAALALAVSLPASALGAHPFPNPEPYVALTPAAGAGQVVPLINSGDDYHGVVFEGIPDGIGVVPGSGTVDLYVTHEQSHVPFGGFADFQDSSVSRVTVTTGASKQVVGLDVALSPDLGFIRFCSAFMAGPDQGFDDYTFLVNEESNDIIDVVPGAPYGADPAIAPYRQAGYSVALNADVEDDVTVLSRDGPTQPREHGRRAGGLEVDCHAVRGRHVHCAVVAALPPYRERPRPAAVGQGPAVGLPGHGHRRWIGRSVRSVQ